ncbi:helix-turn-helix transcriptional regulator [Bacillus gibsonii]|nr:helix-turn-helix transcriptional regulator [Alkalicoccobacillus gibsonii]
MRERLKEVRLNNRMTLQEMADQLGVSKPYYWQIENGERRLYYDLAVSIAAIFNMKPDDIFLPKELTSSYQISE